MNRKQALVRHARQLKDIKQRYPRKDFEKQARDLVRLHANREARATGRPYDEVLKQFGDLMNREANFQLEYLES